MADVVSSGQLVKRYTVCKVVDHNWKKVEYPDGEGSAYFLRCLRCGKWMPLRAPIQRGRLMRAEDVRLLIRSPDAGPSDFGASREEVVVDTGQMLKRITVCKVADHDWKKVEYPGSEGSGYFLRCLRCGKENHNAGGAVPGSHIL